MQYLLPLSSSRLPEVSANLGSRTEHNFGATQARKRPSWRSSQRGPGSQTAIVWVQKSWRPFSFRSANGARRPPLTGRVRPVAAGGAPHGAHTEAFAPEFCLRETLQPENFSVFAVAPPGPSFQSGTLSRRHSTRQSYQTRATGGPLHCSCSWEGDTHHTLCD